MKILWNSLDVWKWNSEEIIYNVEANIEQMNCLSGVNNFPNSIFAWGPNFSLKLLIGNEENKFEADIINYEIITEMMEPIYTYHNDIGESRSFPGVEKKRLEISFFEPILLKEKIEVIKKKTFWELLEID